MLTLYELDRSPYCWKVRIALAEKKVPYNSVTPENKGEDPAFAKLNPFRLTPVLKLDDGRTLYESTIINEYLEEAFPSPAMLPKDPYERARIRLLEDTTDQYFVQASRGMTLSQFEYAPPHLVRKRADQVDHATLEQSRIKVHEHLARLEGELAGRTWFGGEVFSLADAGLVPGLTGLRRIHGMLPDPKYPNLSAWLDRASARPSVRDTAPKQPLTIKEA